MPAPRPPAEPSALPRRALLGRGLSFAAGLWLGGGSARAAILPLLASTTANPKASAVIHLHLDGGLSHLDSFDPKPHAPLEIRGPFGTVASKLDGEVFSEHLPRLAARADRIAVLRAMTHGEAAHERGRSAMLTGYRPSPAIAYPSMGSVFAKELGARGALPPYVAIPNDSEPALGTGYLSAAHGPFSIGGEPSRSDFRVRDLEPADPLAAERRERRRHLVAQLDGTTEVPEADAVQALESFSDRAHALVDDPAARAAFRVQAEPQALRDKYGSTAIGQRLLLARRLATAGVRYIAVQQGGYDHHRDLSRSLQRNLTDLDRALAALLDDLDQSGRASDILLVVSTEFGRTPRFNRDRGRDHWPRCFSGLIAGAGIRRGVIHGRSDSEGAAPEDGAVRPADLAATVFQLAGIDPTKRLMSPGNRPIDIVRDGQVIEPILA